MNDFWIGMAVVIAIIGAVGVLPIVFNYMLRLRAATPSGTATTTTASAKWNEQPIVWFGIAIIGLAAFGLWLWAGMPNITKYAIPAIGTLLGGLGLYLFVTKGKGLSLVLIGAFVGLLAFTQIGPNIVGGLESFTSGSSPTRTVSASVSEWSSETGIPVGCTIKFAAGNGSVYKVQWRLYASGWKNHVPGSYVDMSHVRFKALDPSMTTIPYTIKC